MHDSHRTGRRAPRLRLGPVLGAAGALLPALLTLSLWASAPASARRPAASQGPIQLRSGQLTVTLNARTYQVLTKSTRGAVSRTRSLKPIKPGDTSVPGVFAFPLIRGRVNLATLTGTALSNGGIEFNSIAHDSSLGQDSLVQFKLKNLALDLSTSPVQLTATFLGQHTYHDLPIATLGLARSQATHRGRKVTISGLVLKLLASGAQLFNQQAFNNQMRRFKAGETVGSLTLTGNS